MEPVTVTGSGLSKLCRLCLSNDTSMVDIFWTSPKITVKMADIIMECIPVQITKHDELPKIICRVCCIQLENFRYFRRQAVKSERTLRHYLRQLKTIEKHPRIEYLFQESVLNRGDNSLAALNKNTNGIVQVYIKEEPPTEEIDTINDETSIAPWTSSTFFLNKKDKSIVYCKSSQHRIDEELVNYSPLHLVQTHINQSTDNITNSFSTESNKLDSHVESVNTNIDDAANAIFNSATELGVKKITAADANVILGSKFIQTNMAGDSSPSKNVNGRPKPYPCDVCNKRFVYLSHLKMHKLIHSGEKPHQCDICTMRFVQLSQLKTHKLRHTGEKPHNCDICSKCFSQSGDLKKHKLQHTDEKPHRCDVCNKCFARIDALKTHKVQHTGEKRHQCEVCSKRFALSHHLKTHKLLHSGEKPHQCDVCNKCFLRLDVLKAHKLLHTGAKPYQCDICSKDFAQLANLKRHKLLHTGEKPHQCEVCNKCFTQFAHLKKHRLQHINKDPF